MNRKQVIKEIDEFLRRGQSKEDIFKELSQKYHEEDMLAKLICMFPAKERREKYKNLNNALFYILILTALLKVLVSWPILLSVSPYAILIVLIVPLLNIWFATEVWKMRGYIYRILGLFAIYGIFESAEGFFKQGAWILLDVALLGVIAILSFYMGSKLFPNYGFFGPKKDSNGKYVL